MCECLDRGDRWVLILLAALLFIGWTSCCLRTSREIAVNNEHRRAIEAGAGRWVANPETGVAEFRYGVQEKD